MYSGRLGIAPVIIAAAIPAVENLFNSIFGGNNQGIEPGVTTEINTDVTNITNNITDINTPGTVAYTLFVKMRCLAGDKSMNQLAQPIFGGFAVPPGCGYAHNDSRSYAASGVLTVANIALAHGINVPTVYTVTGDGGVPKTVSVTGAVSTSSPSTTPGGTLPVNIGGGLTLGVPVGVGSLLNAQIFGVPVLAVGAGIVALAFAVGGKRRR